MHGRHGAKTVTSQSLKTKSSLHLWCSSNFSNETLFWCVFLNYGWNSPNVKLCLLNFLEHLSHKILTDNICSSEMTMLQWAWGSDRLLNVWHVFLVLCSCKCWCPKSWSGKIAEIWRAANETFWRPDASSSSETCSVHHLSFARVINESWYTSYREHTPLLLRHTPKCELLVPLMESRELTLTRRCLRQKLCSHVEAEYLSCYCTELDCTVNGLFTNIRLTIDLKRFFVAQVDRDTNVLTAKAL